MVTVLFCNVADFQPRRNVRPKSQRQQSYDPDFVVSEVVALQPLRNVFLLLDVCSDVYIYILDTTVLPPGKAT